MSHPPGVPEFTPFVSVAQKWMVKKDKRKKWPIKHYASNERLSNMNHTYKWGELRYSRRVRHSNSYSTTNTGREVQ
jgi:hypothetical protein